MTNFMCTFQFPGGIIVRERQRQRDERERQAGTYIYRDKKVARTPKARFLSFNVIGMNTELRRKQASGFYQRQLVHKGGDVKREVRSTGKGMVWGLLKIQRQLLKVQGFRGMTMIDFF